MPAPPDRFDRMPAAAGEVHGNGPDSRPGIVTSAAALGFTIGGLGLLIHVLTWGDISQSGLSVGLTALLTGLTFVGVAMDLTMLFGARLALAGRDPRILVLAAGVAIVIQIIGMFIYFAPRSLVSLIIPTLIIAFMMSARSRAWFRLKGAKTF